MSTLLLYDIDNITFIKLLNIYFREKIVSASISKESREYIKKKDADYGYEKEM